MSVLARHELEQSPLADLHALAAELGIEDFRRLRRERLIDAILDAQGGEPETPTSPEAAAVPQAGLDELAVEESPAALEEPMVDDAAPVGEEEPEEIAEEEAEEEVEETGDHEEEDERRERAPRRRRDAEEEVRSGTLDVLPNGSGFLRADPYTHSRDDVYVSPAQIRRCELRPGDEVSGPVRPPRRSERYPSLIRVDSVNGREAEPPEERASFSELTPVFATERLSAPAALAEVPFGRGSRVAIGGPSGAGATTLLREVYETLRASHPELELSVVLAGVRPEEVTEWRDLAGEAVVGGAVDQAPDDLAQVAAMALERAKRAVERGGHAALVVDGLDALAPGAARRLFAAARATREAGTLTIVAATGAAGELQRLATTRVVLGEDGRPGPGSGTLRAEQLA